MEWEKQETMRLLQGRPGTLYQESSDDQKQEFRTWVKNVLKTGITTIEFVKNDGSLRAMKATLDYTHIPTVPTATDIISESDRKPAPVNNEVCKVWDTEAGAWRSFRYDRIKRISLEIG